MGVGHFVQNLSITQKNIIRYGIAPIFAIIITIYMLFVIREIVSYHQDGSNSLLFPRKYYELSGCISALFLIGYIYYHT